MQYWLISNDKEQMLKYIQITKKGSRKEWQYLKQSIE